MTDLPDLTYLGHHSWILEYNGTRIFVDPCLRESFGSCSTSGFEIVPTRQINQDMMPQPSAVVLRNFHEGHFDLRSFSAFRATEVNCSDLAPPCIVEAIESLGHRVKRRLPGEWFSVGNTRLRFIPASADAPLWEQDGSHIDIRFDHETSTSGVFFQTDSFIHDSLSRKILNEVHPDRYAVVAAYNSQLFPAGTSSPFDDVIRQRHSNGSTVRALTSLVNVLTRNLGAFSGLRVIVLSGSGFSIPGRSFGVFDHSDLPTLAETANAISGSSCIAGLYPGQRIRICGTSVPLPDVSYVSRDVACQQQSHAGRSTHEFGSRPGTKGVAVGRSSRLFEQEVEVASGELNRLSPLLITSACGVAAVSLDDYCGKPLGPLRIGIRLLSDDSTAVRTFCFNVNTCAFEESVFSASELLSAVPFGLECYASDIAAVSRGVMSIWEAAMMSMRQWYCGGLMNSLVAFLLCAYSNRVRHDLLTLRLEREARP